MDNENIEEIAEVTSQILETTVTFTVSPKAAVQVATVIVGTTIVANILTFAAIGAVKVWVNKQSELEDFD